MSGAARPLHEPSLRRGRSMTQGQKVIIVIGVLAAVLLAAFPPFVIPGRMLFDIVYAPAWHPPASLYPSEEEYRVYVHPDLFWGEFAALGVTTAVGLFCLRRRRGKASA